MAADIRAFLSADDWRAAKFETFAADSLAQRVYGLAAGTYVYAPEAGRVTKTGRVVRLDAPTPSGLRRWYFAQIDPAGAPKVAAAGTVLGRTFLNGTTGEPVPLAVSLEEVDGSSSSARKRDVLKWLSSAGAGFPGVVDVRQAEIVATPEGPAAATVPGGPRAEKLTPTPSASSAPPPVIYQAPGGAIVPAPKPAPRPPVPPIVWVGAAAGVGLILWGLSRGSSRRRR